MLVSELCCEEAGGRFYPLSGCFFARAPFPVGSKQAHLLGPRQSLIKFSGE